MGMSVFVVHDFELGSIVPQQVTQTNEHFLSTSQTEAVLASSFLHVGCAFLHQLNQSAHCLTIHVSGCSCNGCELVQTHQMCSCRAAVQATCHLCWFCSICLTNPAGEMWYRAAACEAVPGG